MKNNSKTDFLLGTKRASHEWLRAFIQFKGEVKDIKTLGGQHCSFVHTDSLSLRQHTVVIDTLNPAKFVFCLVNLTDVHNLQSWFCIYFTF